MIGRDRAWGEVVAANEWTTCHCDEVMGVMRGEVMRGEVMSDESDEWQQWGEESPVSPVSLTIITITHTTTILLVSGVLGGVLRVLGGAGCACVCAVRVLCMDSDCAVTAL